MVAASVCAWRRKRSQADDAKADSPVVPSVKTQRKRAAQEAFDALNKALGLQCALVRLYIHNGSHQAAHEQAIALLRAWTMTAYATCTGSRVCITPVDRMLSRIRLRELVNSEQMELLTGALPALSPGHEPCCGAGKILRALESLTVSVQPAVEKSRKAARRRQLREAHKAIEMYDPRAYAVIQGEANKGGESHAA